MPEKPLNPPADRSIKRTPAYLWSIIAIFIMPVVLLTRTVLKMAHKKPLVLSVCIISVIGWTWSWNVSYHNWWTFGEEFLVGWRVIPHLPLEETLFYPFGGLLCIYLYIAAHKPAAWRDKRNSGFIWVAMILGSLAFGLAAFLRREYRPSYLYSQLVTYNLLTCLLPAPFAAKGINPYALAVPIAGLGTAGYLWDHFALGRGWWVYNAVTRIGFLGVPLDEFNFYLFAPVSAVSVYVLVCRLLKLPPVVYNE